ncbi:MAG TPA: hypothetical protein DCX53_12615 [Anaerolineae bacterium]|nr:hypothetical protein [Anaerolineae bacterium]
MNLQKPTLVHVIAWTTLASGVVNLFWGLIASGTALATIVGVICTPFTFLPTVLGVFELIYAAKLFSNPPQIIKPSTNIAVFEIASVLTGNVFSMAVGILSLVFYNDGVVKDYFARLNGTLTTAPPSAPQPPASAPDSEPASTSVESAPASEETPAKPKRAPRKVAKK